MSAGTNTSTEATPYSFRFVFFWNEYPSSLSGVFGASTGLLWVTASLLRGVGSPTRYQLPATSYGVPEAKRNTIREANGAGAQRSGLRLKYRQGTTAVSGHYGMSGNPPQRTNSPSKASGSPAHIGVRPAQHNLAIKNVTQAMALDER